MIEPLRTALEGRYELGRELGRGGMATVYLARDVKHGRDVAIKVLDPDVARTVGPERFLREIETAARLAHPHVLPLHDSGEAAGFLYYVMPYVKGESLRDRLERSQTMAVDEAVRVTVQIAEALDYAHGEGVIHRDVKPGNIMFEAGHAVLADFGVARAVAEALDEDSDERMTATGTSLGTPLYMSPEQAAGEGEPDGRSDQYSLACVTYEMLASAPPFAGVSARAVLAAILTRDPEPLDGIRKDLPPDLADAVHRALARDPGDRFPRTTDFAEALREAAAGGAEHSAAGVRVAVAGAAVGLAALLAWITFARPGGATGALEAVEAVATVEAVIDRTDWIRAYRLALNLPAAVEDSVRERLIGEATRVDSVLTDPPGAAVSWRPILEPDAPWEPLGTTPVTPFLPREPVLVRLERDGHATRFLWSSVLGRTWPLRAADGLLPDALFVPGGTVNPGVVAGGIWQGDDREVGDYLIDPREVTNREYQEFVDVGGYERRELWEHPFEADGRRLGWEEAMARLVDRTGRPGPATWEIGRYVDGTADHPVTGVSWYEAAAYARFRERELPTLYHWYRAAQVQQGHLVVPLSNIQGDQVAPVGEFPAVTLVGARDMAGNAREWTANAAGEYRLTQGGSWADAVYSFSLAQPLPPLDRSELNGLRLMSDLGDPALLAAAGAPVAYYERDFALDTPVSDEVFEAYRDIYAYDDTPLNPVVDRVDTVQPGIVRERVTFDAAYGGERVVLYVFRPAGESGTPLQTVLYFPGSGVLSQREFMEDADPRSRADLVVRSGRAFAYPVIDGSFERADEFVYPLQDASSAYRDRVIEWYQDVARTLDYLEIRSDVDAGAVAYMGTSLGARMGAIMLALEPRFRTAVLNVAGLSPKPTQAVVDPFNFLPRVDVPVLVISGQFDPIYPLEPSARPFFRGLGSEVKEHYISAGAHFVPWPEFAEQTLSWLDRHLGPVGR